MGLLDRFKRRRRTFSSHFSSYKNLKRSNRKPFQPKEDHRPKKTGLLPKFLKIVKILAALTALFSLLYTLFLTNTFEIQKINVVGENDTLEEQSALNTTMQEYLGKNLITLSLPQIEVALLKKYPYLQTLDLRRSFFHTLTVTLKSYANSANIRVDYEDGTKQFFVVNEKGYIASVGISNEALPTIVMDVTGTDAILPLNTTAIDPEVESTPTSKYTLNQELISQNTLENLLQTSKDFEGKFNMQILEIHYLKQARELHLLTERYFTVWIDLTEDINLQLTKMKKALTSLNIYEADLEYIDLRISGQNGEKVIYRLNE